jgi:hypothetical protein
MVSMSHMMVITSHMMVLTITLLGTLNFYLFIVRTTTRGSNKWQLHLHVQLTFKSRKLVHCQLGHILRPFFFFSIKK